MAQIINNKTISANSNLLGLIYGFQARCWGHASSHTWCRRQQRGIRQRTQKIWRIFRLLNDKRTQIKCLKSRRSTIKTRWRNLILQKRADEESFKIKSITASIRTVHYNIIQIEYQINCFTVTAKFLGPKNVLHIKRFLIDHQKIEGDPLLKRFNALDAYDSHICIVGEFDKDCKNCD